MKLQVGDRVRAKPGTYNPINRTTGTVIKPEAHGSVRIRWDEDPQSYGNISIWAVDKLMKEEKGIMFRAGDKVQHKNGQITYTVKIPEVVSSKGVTRFVIEDLPGHLYIEDPEGYKLAEDKYLFQIGDRIKSKRYGGAIYVVYAIQHFEGKEYLTYKWEDGGSGEDYYTQPADKFKLA